MLDRYELVMKIIMAINHIGRCLEINVAGVKGTEYETFSCRR